MPLIPVAFGRFIRQQSPSDNNHKSSSSLQSERRETKTITITNSNIEWISWSRLSELNGIFLVNWIPIRNCRSLFENVHLIDNSSMIKIPYDFLAPCASERWLDRTEENAIQLLNIMLLSFLSTGFKSNQHFAFSKKETKHPTNHYHHQSSSSINNQQSSIIVVIKLINPKNPQSHLN